MLKKLIWMVLFLPLISCSSGGDDGGTTNETGSNQTVNVIGTWDYAFATSGSACDGLIARGLYTVNANGSNTSQIGTIQLVGEGYDLDSFGNCIFVGVNENYTDDIGEPAVLTANEFIADINADNAGDGTISDSRLISFNDNIIVYEEVYTNGVTIRITLTR